MQPAPSSPPDTAPWETAWQERKGNYRHGRWKSHSEPPSPELHPNIHCQLSCPGVSGSGPGYTKLLPVKMKELVHSVGKVRASGLVRYALSRCSVACKHPLPLPTPAGLGRRALTESNSPYASGY